MGGYAWMCPLHVPFSCADCRFVHTGAATAMHGCIQKVGMAVGVYHSRLQLQVQRDLVLLYQAGCFGCPQPSSLMWSMHWPQHASADPFQLPVSCQVVKIKDVHVTA